MDERQCECDDIREGLHTTHLACRMAAMNGTAIHSKTWVYCPWCGGRLENYTAMALREQAQEKAERDARMAAARERLANDPGAVRDILTRTVKDGQ